MSSHRTASNLHASRPRGELIRVLAPARLHLGFLDLNGGLGRKFGSIGLAIDQPATELTLERAKTDIVEGPEQRRAQRALHQFKAILNLERSYRLSVTRAIPAHAGLGSGTQLAMAVGAALAALEGLETELRALGQMQNRGARSAIGMAAFERGGFVVDGGRGGSDTPPPVIVRADFPAAWRILLVLDPRSVGVHGVREVEAFEKLAPMRKEVSAELCRVTLMQLLPALAESDIEAFGAAVSEVQRINGVYFSSAQGGGIWSSIGVDKLVKRMALMGAVGIGQSSWGPTGFAFASSPEQAAKLHAALDDEARKAGLQLIVARGRNRGALVETVDAGELSETSF